MTDKYNHKSGAEKRKIWSEKQLQLSSRDPKQTKLNFFSRPTHSKNDSTIDPLLKLEQPLSSSSSFYDLGIELNNPSNQQNDLVSTINQKNKYFSENDSSTFKNETNETNYNDTFKESEINILNPFLLPKQNSPIYEKMAFLKLHPIQPSDIKSLSFDPRKVYFRLLPTGESVQRKWLSYCIENKSVYCSICMAFSMDKNTSFCTGSVVNIKNLYERLNKHEKSLSHSDATSCYLINKFERNVQNLINTERELVVKNNREIVHRVINIILLLSKQNIGFRGKRHEAAYDLNDLQNNHGNFLEVVNFLSTYDPIMRVHIDKVSKKSAQMKKIREENKSQKHGRGSLITFLSKTTIRNIIVLMGNIIQKAIAADVVAAGLFSLEVDSTQDITVKDQMCICVRFVNVNSENLVQERLLKMVTIKSATGEAQYRLIKKELCDLNIDLKLLVSDSFDGASNMSGKYKGLQNQLKIDAPNSIFTHCHAHVLNLVIQDSVKCCISAQNVFSLINKTAVFFTESYKRADVWTDTICENETGTEKLRKLKKIGVTRWNSADDALRSIFNTWSDQNETELSQNHYYYVLDALHTIAYADNTDPHTASDARALIINWISYETIITAFLFLQLFSNSSIEIFTN